MLAVLIHSKTVAWEGRSFVISNMLHTYMLFIADIFLRWSFKNGSSIIHFYLIFNFIYIVFFFKICGQIGFDIFSKLFSVPVITFSLFKLGSFDTQNGSYSVILKVITFPEEI